MVNTQKSLISPAPWQACLESDLDLLGYVRRGMGNESAVEVAGGGEDWKMCALSGKATVYRKWPNRARQVGCEE